jgi:DNA-binding IclR family transcriptional regulator
MARLAGGGAVPVAAEDGAVIGAITAQAVLARLLDPRG